VKKKKEQEKLDFQSRGYGIILKSNERLVAKTLNPDSAIIIRK
jgi:hypothetical protein